MMPYLDSDRVRDGVLRWLESSVPPRERLALPERRRPAGGGLGLVSLSPSGVRANTTAFWWTREGPFFTLALLALLDVPLLNRDQVVVWVKAQQRPDGLFQKGWLGNTVREATFAACVLIRLLGAERDAHDWDRARLVELLRAQQRPGERRHVAFLPGDLRSAYAELSVAACWLGSLAALGETVPDREAAIRYLQAKQDRDGDFEPCWVKTLPYGYEQAARDAVRGLALFGAAPSDPDACVAALRSWQTDDGGFASIWARHPDQPLPRAGRVSQLNWTSWTVVALSLLGAPPPDPAAALRYLISNWDDERGCFANRLTGWYDYGYPRLTYWGLLALSLLGGLHPAPVAESALRTLALLCHPVA